MRIRETVRKMFVYRTRNQEYQVLTPKIIHIFVSCILPSWWVVFFLLICYTAYDHSVIKLNHEYAKLHHQYEDLLLEKRKALITQQDFLLQVNSQSDQDWVELTLMKVLGLFPEEQIKVLFTETN